MEEELTYFNDEWNPKDLKFRRSNNFVKCDGNKIKQQIKKEINDIKRTE